MSRRIVFGLVLAGLVVACKGDDDAEDTGSEDTGGETDYHPLVPEKYRYMWDTDGCTTEEGKPGVKVYWLVDEGEGSANAMGHFTATERWYWFTGDRDNDCVDEFSIQGDYATFDYGMLGCSECDEAFEIRRTLGESGCNYTYYSIFGLEERPEEEIYDAIVLFDTLTPSGNPNMDNRMLVVQGSETPDGYVMNRDFAIGHIYPEGEEYTFPASYDWLGDACFGTGD